MKSGPILCDANSVTRLHARSGYFVHHVRGQCDHNRVRPLTFPGEAPTYSVSGRTGLNVSPRYSKAKKEHIRSALASRYSGRERIPDVLITRN